MGVRFDVMDAADERGGQIGWKEGWMDGWMDERAWPDSSEGEAAAAAAAAGAELE